MPTLNSTSILINIQVLIWIDGKTIQIDSTKSLFSSDTGMRLPGILVQAQPNPSEYIREK